MMTVLINTSSAIGPWVVRCSLTRYAAHAVRISAPATRMIRFTLWIISGRTPERCHDRSWHRSGVRPDMIQSVKRIILVAGALILTACAAYRVKEQRTTQGPMAEDVFINTVIMANGREPNFDERRHLNN